MIMKVLSAMKAGESLKDPAKWKNRQDTANLISMVLVAVIAVAKVAGYEIPLDDEQVAIWGTAGAGVLYAINSYLIKATSEKMGKK